MKLLLDWNSRRCVRALEDYCFWIGIVFFFVCAVSGLFSNQSSACNYVSGISFIAGLFMEIVAWKSGKRIEVIDVDATEKMDRKSAQKEEQHRAEINLLKSQSEEAKQAAAKAIKHAEQEALARARLEERLSPRTLTPAQQDALREKAASLGAQSLDVLVIGSEMEIHLFEQKITESLGQAGWHVRVWNVISGMSCTGVVISTRKESGSTIENLASEFTSALMFAGVASGRGSEFGDELPAALSGPGWDKNSIAALRMYIGECHGAPKTGQ